jgi:hypothetical protein
MLNVYDSVLSSTSSTSTPSWRGLEHFSTNRYISPNTVSIVSYENRFIAMVLDLQLRNQFKTKANRLLEETKFESSIFAITSNQAFLDIVGMGNNAIKFILEEMKDGNIRVQWFPALKRIAHEDPVPPEWRGKVREMADAWLQWGERTGIV